MGLRLDFARNSSFSSQAKAQNHAFFLFLKEGSSLILSLDDLTFGLEKAWILSLNTSLVFAGSVASLTKLQFTITHHIVYYYLLSAYVIISFLCSLSYFSPGKALLAGKGISRQVHKLCTILYDPKSIKVLDCFFFCRRKRPVIAKNIQLSLSYVPAVLAWRISATYQSCWLDVSRHGG